MRGRGRPLKGKFAALLPGPDFVRTKIAETFYAERDAEFISRFRNGETMQEIAWDYGISRERVRQRLSLHGLVGAKGGASLRALKKTYDRRAAKAAKREARCLDLFGVPLETLYEITGNRRVTGLYNNKNYPITLAYLHQKRNAAKRGIEWEFDLASWWKVWRESGKWAERGRGHGYGMSRWGDSGPYSPDNVYICTCAQNSSDSYLVHPASERTEKRRQTRLSVSP